MDMIFERAAPLAANVQPFNAYAGGLPERLSGRKLWIQNTTTVNRDDMLRKAWVRGLRFFWVAHNMKCILISLESQPARRERVEANFRAIDHAGWEMTYLKAVDAEQVAKSAVQGRLAPAEKGCFLSHLVAMQSTRESTEPILLVEDDVLFGARSFSAIDAALQSAAHTEWDILFTDVCVPSVHAMVNLYWLRRQLTVANETKLVPLSSVPFAGSTAYLVNGKSKDKLIGLLTENAALDVPYDLTLRRLVQQSRLTGFVIFPFPTTLSSLADVSQIQRNQATKVADMAWNAFRRLVWAERSVEDATANLDRISDDFFDPECKAFTRILSCMLSSNFQPK
jgi:GR25 family glycosyltransferase involved in LPS biosynthesis